VRGLTYLASSFVVVALVMAVCLAVLPTHVMAALLGICIVVGGVGLLIRAVLTTFGS
jgi:hypothetical protein